MELQTALKASPGTHCAVSLYKLNEGNDHNTLRTALAEVLKVFEQAQLIPENLHVVVAINPATIGHGEATHVLPKKSARYTMPSTQCDALFQVSAMTHTDLLFALRIIEGLLASRMQGTTEILGAHLRYGQEPFGFYHGEEQPQEKLKQVAMIKEGQLAGGAWLLYQQYVQHLPAFYALNLKQQAKVMGAEPIAEHEIDTSLYPASSHTKVVSSPSELPQMVRRGFAFRHAHQEGSIFIAASNALAHFHDTLQRMVDIDAMLDFTETREGGVYFVPPNADWLDPSASTPDIPADARYLPLHQKGHLDLATSAPPENTKPIALQDYTVAKVFVDYLNALRANGLFTGPVGNQAFSPETGTLLKAINAVLAGAKLDNPPVTSGANPELLQTFNTLLEASLSSANRFNDVAQKYMTVG